MKKNMCPMWYLAKVERENTSVDQLVVFHISVLAQAGYPLTAVLGQTSSRPSTTRLLKENSNRDRHANSFSIR